MSGRRAVLSLAAALLFGSACAHTHFEAGGVRYAIDRGACCAVPEGTDYVAEAAACEARGCVWQHGLLCMGVPWPDDETEDAYYAERDACHLACACVCPADEEACRHAA